MSTSKATDLAGFLPFFHAAFVTIVATLPLTVGPRNVHRFRESDLCLPQSGLGVNPHSCAAGYSLEVHVVNGWHADDIVCRSNSGVTFECHIGCEKVPDEAAPYCQWELSCRACHESSRWHAASFCQRHNTILVFDEKTTCDGTQLTELWTSF